MADNLLQNTALLIENEVMNPIKSDLSSKGIDNSKQASNSLRVEIKESENKVILWGVDYLEVLNKGRGPGKFPPINEIKLWVESKPVDISPYLVARKIAREGTRIFKDNTKGIQLEDKVINLRNELKKKIPYYAKEKVLNKLRKFNKARLK